MEFITRFYWHSFSCNCLKNIRQKVSLSWYLIKTLFSLNIIASPDQYHWKKVRTPNAKWPLLKLIPWMSLAGKQMKFIKQRITSHMLRVNLGSTESASGIWLRLKYLGPLFRLNLKIEWPCVRVDVQPRQAWMCFVQRRLCCVCISLVLSVNGE